MKRERSRSTRRGWWRTNAAAFSTVEAILAASIFAMIVTAFVGAYLYGQEATRLGGNRARASMLAEEGIEVVRNMRDANYASVANGPHGLALAGNDWAFLGTQDVTGPFTRRIDISSVDANRKLVTSTVTWQQNAQRSGTVSYSTWLTNWHALGTASWAYAFEEAVNNISGNNDGYGVATQGTYAYLIRNGGSPNFVVYDVSVPSAPTIAGAVTIPGTLTGIDVSGNYVYVSNQDNAQELQIIDVSNPAVPVLAGSYNAPGTANANDVFASGSTVYLTRVSSADNELAIVNTTIPSAPTLIGSLNLGATAYEVTVVGNYAYIASAGNAAEVQTVNISNPTAPSLANSINLSGNGDATTIAGSAAGLVIGQGTDIHTASIANPASPVRVGTLSVGGNVNSIALGAYAFLGTSAAPNEFQIVDISTLAAPALLSTVNLAGTSPLNGVAYNGGLDRVFGASAGNALEFVVFAPQ